MRRKEIVIGERFERLIVIEQVEHNSRGCRQVLWQCDCGIRKVIAYFRVVSGHTQSCGCIHREMQRARWFKDLTGQRFTRLLVIAEVGRNKFGKSVWKCLCDCGGNIQVVAGSLTSGNTRSCGCLMRELGRQRTTTHGQSKTKAYSAYISRTRQAAKRHRTPKWSDLDAIRKFYVECPKGMTVDHIIPLKGKLVSGLHVPNNLQYLTGHDNSKKNYRFTPCVEVKGETPRWFDEMNLPA